MEARQEEKLLQQMEQMVRPLRGEPFCGIIPIIVLHLGLNPFQLTLWVHYFLAGAIKESLAETGERTGMSKKKAWETRQELADMGLISLEEADGKLIVAPTDIWPATFDWLYSGTLLSAAEWFKLYRDGQAPTPKRKVRRAESEPAEKLTGVRAMQSALLEAMGRDKRIGSNWIQVAKPAKELLSAGYTVAQVLAAFGPGGWWYKTWRGAKGQKPELYHITQNIREAITTNLAAPNGNGNANKNGNGHSSEGGMSINSSPIFTVPAEPD